MLIQPPKMATPGPATVKELEEEDEEKEGETTGKEKHANDGAAPVSGSIDSGGDDEIPRGSTIKRNAHQISTFGADQSTMTMDEVQYIRLHKDYGMLRPDCMELYLTAKEFEQVFKMDKEAFKKFPKWRQSALKREYGLF